MNQPSTMVWNNTVNSPGSNWASKRFLKEVYAIAASWMKGRKIHLSISCWLHSLTWTIWYQYLYTHNYKDVNIYHQVFCYPKSANTWWNILFLTGKELLTSPSMLKLLLPWEDVWLPMPAATVPEKSIAGEMLEQRLHPEARYDKQLH